MENYFDKYPLAVVFFNRAQGSFRVIVCGSLSEVVDIVRTAESGSDWRVYQEMRVEVD